MLALADKFTHQTKEATIVDMMKRKTREAFLWVFVIVAPVPYALQILPTTPAAIATLVWFLSSFLIMRILISYLLGVSLGPLYLLLYLLLIPFLVGIVFVVITAPLVTMVDFQSMSGLPLAIISVLAVILFWVAVALVDSEIFLRRQAEQDDVS